MTWLEQFATDMGPLDMRPHSDTVVSYTTMALPTAQQLWQSSWIFLFLPWEVCHNALQTLGSVHLQAASPYFPASCSKQAKHSSPPFPSLPKREFCLLWLHELHTISKKQKQYENIEDSRAWSNFTRNVNYTYRDWKSGKLGSSSWFCFVCLDDLRQVIFVFLGLFPPFVKWRD